MDIVINEGKKTVVAIEKTPYRIFRGKAKIKKDVNDVFDAEFGTKVARLKCLINKCEYKKEQAIKEQKHIYNIINELKKDISRLELFVEKMENKSFILNNEVMDIIANKYPNVI
jgi:hypothetical protein